MNLLILIIGLLGTFLPKATDNVTENTKIDWMSWEEAVAANETQPRKLLVDVYTDWCHWCKVMDKKTFSKQEIVAYINEHFYAIKLNAEGKQDIEWNDRIFSFKANGRRGSHELASALLDGEMSYPSFVFLTEDYEKIRVSKGFKPATPFLEELKFAAEEQYKQMTE
ncbi:MAG: DUF255 domain-containing protein [Saprospiraceae bacterium]|nr:DUF255 domain-containing protein [Saprospiraceae bacterium]